MKYIDIDVIFEIVDPLIHFMLFNQDPTYRKDQKQRIAQHIDDFLVDQVIIRLHDKTRGHLYNAISDRLYLDFIDGVFNEKKA